MDNHQPDLPALFKKTVARRRAEDRPHSLLLVALLKAGYPRVAVFGAVYDLRNGGTRRWVRGDFWPRMQALVMKHAMDGQDTHSATVFGLSRGLLFELARSASQGSAVGHHVP